MGTGYLLDSNVIIGYLAGRIDAPGMKVVSGIVDQRPQLSVISKIEVLRFNDTPENEAILNDFVDSSIILPLGNIVVQLAIELCRHSRIKLPDAIIAATAQAENLVLVTRNTDDFKHISDLQLLNPWAIQ